MTAFLALTDALKAALQAAPALAGVPVVRGRAVPFAAGVDRGIALNIKASRATQLDINGDSMQWDTTVAIALFQRAAVNSDAEAAIDPLLASVWATVVGLTPPAGVYGMTLDPSIQWDVEEADQIVVSATMALRISHYTTGAALAAA